MKVAAPRSLAGGSPRALLSALQRALIAVLVVGSLALASAGLMTVSSAHSREPAPAALPVSSEPGVRRIELPRVLIHAKRLPQALPAHAARASDCPLPGDAGAVCPVPTEPTR